MSDIIVQANKNSVILNSLDRAHRSDLSYKPTKNYPMLSKQLIELQPNIPISGAAAGREIIFTLPRYGIMTNLTLESAVITGASTTVNSVSHALGAMLFETIELRSHNKVIVSNSDAYTRVRIDQSKFEPSFEMLRHAMPLSSTTYLPVSNASTAWPASAGGSVTVFTPFFCSFFEDHKNYLDLNYVEQLQLRAVVNTTARSGLATAISSLTTTCWMEYYNMESSALAELRSKNFKPEMPLNMLTYDSYTETETLEDNATSTTIKLNVNNAVFASHVFLRDNSAGGLGAFQAITEVSVNMGGRKLYDTVPAPIMKQCGNRHFGTGIGMTGGSSTAIQRFTSTPISIYWGLEPESRTWNSGAVSFNNINTPQLVLTHADPGTVVDVFVVHEYWTITTINPSDGTLLVSSSI